jgi:hypothetical protein
MARKWYRSLIEPSGDEHGDILVGGAYPGEVFMYDYDRPGYSAQHLIDNGVIEELAQEPTKDELAGLARRFGVAGGESMKKEDLIIALDPYWEG